MRGPTIHAASCPQPPLDRDHATFTAAELDYYGLPHRGQGESLAHWQMVVRNAKYRSCDMTPTNAHARMLGGVNTWTGVIAEHRIGTNDWYNEVDSDWYVPCVAVGSPQGAAWSWVGIGGVGNGNLVQTGTRSDVYYDIFGTHYTYEAWVENTANPSNGNAYDVMSVDCNDHVWAKVYNGNCMFVDDWTSGGYTGVTCFGPDYDESTAEVIMERPSVNGSAQPLSDFQSETFREMGVTDGYNYVGINTVPYYTQVMDGGLTTLGSIVYYAGDNPPRITRPTP